MYSAIHQDRGELAAPVSGTLFEGKAAAIHGAGSPLRYPQGSEYRAEPELKSIVEQLPGKPVTLLHPNGLIKNGVPARIIGRVVTARLEGDHAIATLMVDSSAGLAAIRGGTHELSLGYTCNLDEQRYQKGVVVDHLAVVPIARCSTCALRADGHDHLDCGCGCGGTCNNRAIIYTLDNAMSLVDQAQTGTLPDRLPVMGETVLDKDLSAKDRHAIPAGHFGIPSREGLPLNDKSHVQNAMARFNQTEFKSPAERKAARHRIIARAHELGIDPSGFAKEHGDDEGIIHGGITGGGGGESEDSMESKMNHTDDAAGGGEGIAQNASPTGMAAPDIHARLADALKNMSELQVKHSVLTEKFDAESKAHGVTKEAQLKAEKERDEGKTRADKAEKERDEYKAQLDAMKSGYDGARKDAEEATKRADGALEAAKLLTEKARQDADAAVQTHIAARADLLMKANQLAGATDRTAMSDREIMCQVVKHLDGAEIAGTESNDYVRAYFSAVAKRHMDAAGSVAGVRQTLQQLRENADALPLSGMDAEKVVQAQMIDRASKAWNSKKN